LRNLYTVHQQQLCCYSFLVIPLTRTELIERVGLRSLSSIEKQTSTCEVSRASCRTSYTFHFQPLHPA
jgi:hypothetical protein